MRGAINTDMVSKHQASNKKAGAKFDLIKTVGALEQAQNPGSSTHYESLLKQRQEGKIVVRPRDQVFDEPFDDEELPCDLDQMTIDTFNKRYLSNSSPFSKQGSATLDKSTTSQF